MRALLLSLLLGGCIATVQARPADPVFCMEAVAPILACNVDYLWLPGYWAYDGWGRQTWVRGRYIPRYSDVRDHRR